MNLANHIWTIAYLTIHEGRRRLIIRLSLGMSVVFLIIFGLGLHYIFLQFEEAGVLEEQFIEIPRMALTTAGLYVTNFLIVIMSVLISVASVPQEIDTRIMDTIVTKPTSRPAIILGKWVGFALMIVLYTLFVAGGIITLSYFRTGLVLDNAPAGLALMCLNGLVVMSITISFGTRLSTLANGVLAFMLYGIAFIGGWMETIGTVFRNQTAKDLGIIASLILPTEALWRKASLLFIPRLLGSAFAGPFTVNSEPSTLMIIYAVFYVGALLVFGMVSFSQRDL